MQLLYLSRVGEHYDAEEGTSGVRLVALGNLETGLKKALLDKKNAEGQLQTLKSQFEGTYRPLPVPGETAFQRSKRMQTEAIERQKMMSLSPKDKFAREQPIRAAIEKAEKQIKRLKTWLLLENATVKVDGSIDWSTSNRTVEYDHDLARQDLTKLRFNGGKIYTDNGFAQPFDTTNLVTHFSGPGKAIYVMSKEGNIHASSHSVGYRHHSSLLAGRKTAGAGELEVKAGVLTWISNKSGHYQPNLKHFLQVLHVLEKGGISNSFKITYMSSAGKQEFNNTAAFQTKLQTDDEEWDYEFNKLLLYSQHLTDPILAGHAPNPWRWRNAPAGELPGVYDAVTSTLVPHRDVRRWLKGQGLYMQKEVQNGVGR